MLCQYCLCRYSGTSDLRLSIRLKNQNGSFGLASDMLNVHVMGLTRSTRGMIRNNLHHELDTEAHTNVRCQNVHKEAAEFNFSPLWFLFMARGGFSL